MTNDVALAKPRFPIGIERSRGLKWDSWSKNSAHPQLPANEMLGNGGKFHFSRQLTSDLRCWMLYFPKNKFGVDMKSVLHPWQMLLLILAGWINQQQQNTIEYLIAENRILWKKIGKKRILLTDDQRRRLAIKGKVLGRKALAEVCSIVTPETILRWHRDLIAEKRDYSKRRNKTGRPQTDKEIVELLLKMAKENPSWGYDRIQGAMANLGYTISGTAIGNILKEHGIEPAPERKKQTTWNSFLEAHWDVLAAVDFTTIEVWTKSGLCTFYLLFVMEIATRRVSFVGCTSNPDEDWMLQVGRNLVDSEDGFLRGKRYLPEFQVENTHYIFSEHLIYKAA
jgi:putative transposase